MSKYFQSIRGYIGSVTLLSLTGIAVNAASMLAGFVVARRLTTQEYGQYAYLSSMFLLFSVIFGFGLTSQISKDLAERDESRLSQTVSGQLALRLATSLLAIVGGFLLAWLAHDEVYGWSGVWAGLFVYTDFMSGALSGVGRVKSTALVVAVQPVSFLFFIGLVPFTGVQQLYLLLLLSQFLAALTAALVALPDPVLRRWPRLSAMLALPWRSMVAGELYVLGFLQTLYSACGVTLLGAFNHYDEAGSLSIAFTIAQLPSILTGLVIAKLYYPRMCNLYRNGTAQNQQAAFSVTYYLYGLLSLGYSALVIVYADVFVSILYSDTHSGAVPAVRWLAVLSFFLTANQVLSWTLIANNRQRVALVAAALSLALLVIQLFLPLLAPAVAVVYIISSLVAWLLMLWQSRLGHNYLGLLSSIGLLAGMGLVGLAVAAAVRYLWPVSGWAGWQLGRVGFAGLLYLACSLPVLFYVFRRFVAQPLPTNL